MFDQDPIPSVQGTDLIGAFRETAPKDPTAEAETRKLEFIKQLRDDDRWEALKDFIDDLIRQYKDVVLVDSDTPETIGFKYLVSKRVVEVLELVKSLPDKLDQIK